MSKNFRQCLRNQAPILPVFTWEFQMARKLLAPSGELLGPNFNTFSGRGEKSVSQRGTVKSDQNDADKRMLWLY